MIKSSPCQFNRAPCVPREASGRWVRTSKKNAALQISPSKHFMTFHQHKSCIWLTKCASWSRMGRVLQKMWCVLWEWLMNNASYQGLSENRGFPKKRSFGYFSCSNTLAMFVISFSWLEWPVARVPWEAQDHTKRPHVGCRAVFLAASDTPRDEYQPVIWWCEAMPQIDLRWFKNYWPLFRRGSLPQGSWCSIFWAVV